jgi:hypothetical protein
MTTNVPNKTLIKKIVHYPCNGIFIPLQGYFFRAKKLKH